MSASVFLPLGPRFCQQCGNPLRPEARSDQKYCGDRCRGLARRHGAGGIDWPARAEAAEQRAQQLQAQLDQQAQAQEAAQPFEQRYEELNRLLVGLARELPTARVLPAYLDFVDQLLRSYEQHPGLATGEASARRRLTSLQQLRSELAGVYETLLALQAQEQRWKEHALPPPQP